MTWIEIVGLLTVILVVVKSLYNLGHFVYTTFLGRLLGHGIQVRKCGPWAGNSKPFSVYQFEVSFK